MTQNVWQSLDIRLRAQAFRKKTSIANFHKWQIPKMVGLFHGKSHLGWWLGIPLWLRKPPMSRTSKWANTNMPKRCTPMYTPLCVYIYLSLYIHTYSINIHTMFYTYNCHHITSPISWLFILDVSRSSPLVSPRPLSPWEVSTCATCGASWVLKNSGTLELHWAMGP